VVTTAGELYKTCKAPVKATPQHTNTQCFTGRMPFLSFNQQCQRLRALKLKISLGAYFQQALSNLIEMHMTGANTNVKSVIILCARKRD